MIILYNRIEIITILTKQLLLAGNIEISHIGGARTMRTMRVVLQDKPYISVYFPSNMTQESIDTWLAKWYSSRNLTH